MSVLPKRRKSYSDIEESLANLIQQLGEGNPRVLAYLQPKEHSAIAVALAYADFCESNVLKTFINNFIQLSPARRGLARKQLTAIGVSNMGRTEIEDEKFFTKVKRKLHIGE